MLRVAADLPDPGVLLHPVGAGGVGAGDQEPAGVVVDAADLVRQRGGRAEQFPVHVDLALVPGAVADPDRPAVLPAGQMAEFPFAEVVLAAHAEHDL
jgi:hypothetical protein